MSYEAAALIEENIEEYLHRHEHKTLLRFITCGSVDDGKSTLIGRLLYDSKLIFEDQLAAVTADSKKVGTQGGDLDFDAYFIVARDDVDPPAPTWVDRG